MKLNDEQITETDTYLAEINDGATNGVSLAIEEGTTEIQLDYEDIIKLYNLVIAEREDFKAAGVKFPQ